MNKEEGIYQYLTGKETNQKMVRDNKGLEKENKRIIHSIFVTHKIKKF